MHCAIERILALDAVFRMRSTDAEVRASLGGLVGSQMRTMGDVRTSEKALREQENRIIGKYNVVKTDLHFQKAFILKLLEGVLNIFKR